jgi:hypothetical protein
VNNIIIGGDSFFTSDNTGFVAKLNPTATSILWQKSLTVDSKYSNIFTVAVDFNDSIIAVGSAEVEHMVNGATVTDKEMLVAKITSVGGLGWQKSVRLDSDTPFGQAWDLSLDSVGNIYVAGTYLVDNAEATQTPAYSGKKSNAAVIFKMSTLGVIAWDRRVGPGPCDWVGVSTAVDEAGDLYLLANTYQLNPAGGANLSLGLWNSTLALARYNKITGAVIWQRYFDNPHAQDMAGTSNTGNWGNASTDLLAVQGNKILIGGAVRMGASDADFIIDASPDYFNQGFVAQFDTDATPWSAEGWNLKPSRIPGRLTNSLVAVNGPTQLQNDIAITDEGTAGITTQAVGMSVRRSASQVNTWTFGKDGTLTNPEDSNIKLQQTQLGYATM